MKVGFEGVLITRICYPDGLGFSGAFTTVAANMSSEVATLCYGVSTACPTGKAKQTLRLTA